MKLSIFKVLQMLAKSEFLGHVSLSEGLVFWSLQRVVLNPGVVNAGHAERWPPTMWGLSSRKEPGALQETAITFSLLLKTKIQTILALRQQEFSLKHVKQWCQWKHHPEWASPVWWDGTWRDPITLQGKLGSALRTAAGPPLESVPCLAPGKLP